MMLCGAWRLAYAFALLARALAGKLSGSCSGLRAAPASGEPGALRLQRRRVAIVQYYNQKLLGVAKESRRGASDTAPSY